MIPGRILNASMILGRPTDWDDARDGPCGGLPIRVDQDGPHVLMTSAWIPSLDEIVRNSATHPVVSLGVGEVPE